VREIARLMTPGFFGTAIYQINISVASLLAFQLNDKAVTLIYLSNRLMELPIGVFAVAVSTVVYPLIARHAAERKFTALAEDYRRGVRFILLINAPAAAGLALLSGPIVRLLFQHGHFTVDSARAMTPLVTLFAVGLPFFSITNLTVRAFYALKDTATPVKIAGIDFIVNLALSLVLMRRLGTAGLVLASTAAIVVQTLLLQRALVRRLPDLSFAPLWPTVAKIVVATLSMGVMVWGGWQMIEDNVLRPRLADALAVFGLIPLAVLWYGWLLWELRVEGREEITAWLRKKRGA
jgi:putative peptidoglycan lipid II flippase